MNLQDEITVAQSFISDPPKNESSTCEWIILPLLWAAGYARRDIESRIADSTGQYPDYTLLPNDPSFCWYVEAKSWNVSLEDIHAKQVLNYANHNGKRFVVLTNGQVWRLYDNSIQGLLTDKLVSYASLEATTQIIDLLTTLSKTEVLSGSLERLATEIGERKKREALEQHERQQRQEEIQHIHRQQLELRTLLDVTLPDQLNDPNSELILLVTILLNEKERFEHLKSETLSAWFGDLFSKSPSNLEEETTTSIPSQVARSSISDVYNERTLTLKACQGLPIDGNNTKPIALHMPDGTQIPVNSWVGLAEQAVRWLLQQPRPLPIPFESGNRNRWFINNSPTHKRETIRSKFKTITANGKTIYMDSDRAGTTFLQDIYALCQAMQIKSDEVHVTMTG